MKAPHTAGTKSSWAFGVLAMGAMALTAWAWQNPRLMLELMSQAWSCL